jgi:hypothetical protein
MALLPNEPRRMATRQSGKMEESPYSFIMIVCSFRWVSKSFLRSVYSFRVTVHWTVIRVLYESVQAGSVGYIESVL